MVNGALYAVGGFNTSVFSVLNTVEAYNPATNTWTADIPMPTARSALAAAVINGTLYTVGGNNQGLAFLDTVEAYDPATNTWTTKAPMPVTRSFLTAGVVNGTLYAVGGSNGSASGNPFNTVEAFTP